MRKITFICALLLLATTSVLFAVGTEEEQFREDVKANHTEMGVSFEKYEDILSKLLSPDTPWDINLKYVLFGLGLLVLSGVTVFFIRQISRNMIIEVRDLADEPSMDGVLTERAALVQSEAAAASHNFRDALRFLYLSAVFHLQEKGILTYDKSLTNLEYLHTLQTHAELQDALRPAIQIFDDVWYGYKPCNAGTIGNYRALLEKVYLVTG
jgi:hypothetical protein